MASTDLIDPKEVPKIVKSLGMVFSILVLGHIGSQEAVIASIIGPKEPIRAHRARVSRKLNKKAYRRPIERQKARL